MHRRSTLSMASLAPWWLLFVAVFAFVVVQAKSSYDVAVRVADNPPAVQPAR